MDQRIDYREKYPEMIRGIRVIESLIRKSSLKKSLYELVKIRASQINGCAFCIDMHTKDARAAGETEQRIYGLSAWRETPFYTGKERAALEWTESLTLISQNDVPDDLYDRVQKQFNEEELMVLNMAIVAINSWNRLAVSMRTPPGSYEVG